MNSLSLNPEGWVFKDEDIQNLFVEYTFLGSVEETPNSLPKPKDASEAMNYNFCKGRLKTWKAKILPFQVLLSLVTQVDAQNNEQKRSHLAAMVLPTKVVDSKICFTVVSEPTNDEEECDELGGCLFL